MTSLRLLALACFITLLPHFAAAQTCTVRVNALDVEIDEGFFADDDLDATRRERLLGWPRRSLSRALGNPPPCQSDTVLVFMAELTEIYRAEGYCLQYGDADSGFLLIPGERNFRGRCTRTTCDRVQGAAAEMIRLSEGVSTIFGEPPDPDEIARSDSAGAMLVSGSERFIRRRLNNAASGAFLTALSAPPVAAATAVTVVAVGGGVFLCRE